MGAETGFAGQVPFPASERRSARRFLSGNVIGITADDSRPARRTLRWRWRPVLPSRQMSLLVGERTKVPPPAEKSAASRGRLDFLR